MRTIDILPTIADVLGFRIPWKIDGASLFGRREPKAIREQVHELPAFHRPPASRVGQVGLPGGARSQEQAPRPRQTSSPRGLEEQVKRELAKAHRLDYQLDPHLTTTYDPGAPYDPYVGNIPSYLYGQILNAPSGLPQRLIATLNGQPVAIAWSLDGGTSSRPSSRPPPSTGARTSCSSTRHSGNGIGLFSLALGRKGQEPDSGWEPLGRHVGEGMRGRRGVAIAGAELLGVSTIAIAQPLFDALQRSTYAFAAADVRGLDVVLLALCSPCCPRWLMLALELLAGLLSRSLRGWVHLTWIALLVSLFCWQVVKQAGAASHILYVAIPLAGFAGVAASTSDRGRSTPAPHPRLRRPDRGGSASCSRRRSRASPSLEAARCRVSEPAPGRPVVLVVFDEFPLAALLKSIREIDARRFPNFARWQRLHLVSQRSYRGGRDRGGCARDPHRRLSAGGQARHLLRPPTESVHAARLDIREQHLRVGDLSLSPVALRPAGIARRSAQLPDRGWRRNRRLLPI